MSKTNSGGPAFPCDSRESQKFAGMTLRDYFAAKIAAGDAAAGEDGWGVGVTDRQIESRATFYYRMADAMLKAREL
jgi:hypothetical protein